MNRRASVIDMFKNVVDCMFHRTPTETEMDSDQTARLRAMHEHNSQRTTGSQPLVSRSLILRHRLGRKVRLVAYTKYGGATNPTNAQLDAIHRYCLAHDYEIVYHLSWDENFPMMALNTALDTLDFVDGMIVADLDRIVQHHDDPARDLAPMIHDHFFHNSKYLISVKEGIDTSTIFGQNALVQHLGDLRRVA